MLLEAGPPDTLLGSKMLQWKIHMPAALMYNLCDDKYNWYYHTEPQRHLNNRVMYWPRGRVWGGSSSLNAMYVYHFIIAGGGTNCFGSREIQPDIYCQ